MHGYLQNQMQYKPLGWCHLVSLLFFFVFSVFNGEKKVLCVYFFLNLEIVWF